MKRLGILLAAALALAALAAPCAQASFGVNGFDVAFTDAEGEEVAQAGAHPFAMSTTLNINSTATGKGGAFPDEAPRNIFVTQVPGFAGDPHAVPTCSTADFLTTVTDQGGSPVPDCPDSAAVGTISATLASELVSEPKFGAVYNLAPSPGTVNKLGFWIGGAAVLIEVGLSEEFPYRIEARVPDITQTIGVIGSKLTLWGVPADPAHDPLRGMCLNPADGSSFGNCTAGIAERPFLTLPRACQGPLETTYEATSWPGSTDSGGALTHDGSGNPQGFVGCEALPFGPEISAQPTAHSAESPTGLDFGLNVEDPGLANPSYEAVAGSDIESAEVALPEGMTINPSQAEGLAACSEADLRRETATSPFGAGCPGESKLGTVEVETPLLEGQILQGSLFVATPYENPFDSLIALYMTVKDPELGISVNLAGKVEPDPRSGQLITTFGVPSASDPAYRALPQLPFSHFRLHFREGGRSPLITPPACGHYTTRARFTPYADPSHPYETSSAFDVTSGVGGGPCPPGGTPPFHPGFQAGTANNQAGALSPFELELTRQDGDQDMTKLSATLPPGVLGSLVGVSKCTDAEIAQAKARTGPHGGHEELQHPSCPTSSLIGHTLTGAGVGPELLYVPGSLYLAGPYHGAPLSVVAIVPGVAGPFDVGTVVVRVALRFNPVTAQAEADGSASDPIPHILQGIPLKVRDIRVFVNRPSFTFNPTSCEPTQTQATLWGGGADPFSVADDTPFPLAARFQAAGCQSLGFNPSLALNLKGGTRRGAFPRLQGTYAPRPGDANLRQLVLRLPHSAFLEQGHFGTICTRVQYAAGGGFGEQCPPASVYGHIRAITPLLEEPLEGPVFLRSSNHNLPDLIAALHGLVDVEAGARIDSHEGGIRATFAELPDAPLTKVIVDMKGGKKGLIVNSTNLCAAKHRAKASFLAQSGKRAQGMPAVRAQCGGQRKGKKHKRHKRVALRRLRAVNR